LQQVSLTAPRRGFNVQQNSGLKCLISDRKYKFNPYLQVMNRLLLLVILPVLCISSVNAQWYERACGVEDIDLASPEEFACMWDKADELVHAGMRTCGVGSGIALIGGISMFISSTSDGGYSMIGATGIVFGLATVAAGVPLWAVGGSRKSKLMESPAYQDNRAATLQIVPVLQKNQFSKQSCLGVSASLNF
jgi:hypothetical protein